MIPNNFVQFAGELAARNPGSPAAFRSAVSRAYYGVFHEIKSLLENELRQRIRTGGNEHIFVQVLLRNSGVQEADDIAAMLKNLHDSRKQADYELNNIATESRAHAQLCVERAVELQQRIQEIKSPELLGAIGQGIAEYRQKTRQ